MTIVIAFAGRTGILQKQGPFTGHYAAIISRTRYPTLNYCITRREDHFYRDGHDVAIITVQYSHTVPNPTHRIDFSPSSSSDIAFREYNRCLKALQTHLTVYKDIEDLTVGVLGVNPHERMNLGVLCMMSLLFGFREA